MKQRDHQHVTLALRLRFVDMSRDEPLKVWYQQPRNTPAAQIEIWKRYPTHHPRYAGRITYAAICQADGVRNREGRTCHLHEYQTWPNGTACWLTKEQADHLRARARPTRPR